VFRSDDDAQTWTEILSFGQNVKNPPLQQPQVRAGGLAYDPQQPDTVYVALDTLSLRFNSDGGRRGFSGQGLG
jgi:hypothetical protein